MVVHKLRTIVADTIATNKQCVSLLPLIQTCSILHSRLIDEDLFLLNVSSTIHVDQLLLGVIFHRRSPFVDFV